MEQQRERRKFLVGLGNPGRRYAATRHNVGWMVLGELRKRWGLDAGRKAFGGVLYQATPTGPDGTARTVVLLEPLTYMNRSGEAVSGMAGFYKAGPSDLLVVLDDMALPVGRIRARPGGSDGGHNGLKDIIRLMGTDQVPRLRVGIGPPPPLADAVDHVLSGFEADQLPTMEQAIKLAADAAEDWVAHGVRYVMDKYNSGKELTEGD